MAAYKWLLQTQMAVLDTHDCFRCKWMFQSRFIIKWYQGEAGSNDSPVPQSFQELFVVPQSGLQRLHKFLVKPLIAKPNYFRGSNTEICKQKICTLTI